MMLLSVFNIFLDAATRSQFQRDRAKNNPITLISFDMPLFDHLGLFGLHSFSHILSELCQAASASWLAQVSFGVRFIDDAFVPTRLRRIASSTKKPAGDLPCKALNLLGSMNLKTNKNKDEKCI